MTTSGQMGTTTENNADSTADSTAGDTAGVVPPEICELIEARIAKQGFDLPLLPEVATRVLQLCNSPDTDASQLSAVLHQDQAFASHVLRVANSPGMAASVQIVSLQQAVSRLGMAISVQARVFDVPSHRELVARLWRHSLAAGCFAKEVARSRRTNVESAFLCGLLHDVGKPIVLDSVAELECSRGAPYADAEVLLAMDVYHAEVGTMLVRAWNLPDQVGDAVRFHHEYQAAQSFRELAMMVNLADHLAHLTIPTTVHLDEEKVRQLPVVEELNIYPDDLDRLIAQRDNVLQLVEATGG
jgi:putative nucleotidyltransferase with HDIG domain